MIFNELSARHNFHINAPYKQHLETLTCERNAELERKELARHYTPPAWVCLPEKPPVYRKLRAIRRFLLQA